MMDTDQTRRDDRERARRGLRRLSHADRIMRQAWLRIYRDGSMGERINAARALAAQDRMVQP